MIPRVRINAALLDLFELFRIRSSETGQRWRIGDILQVHPGALLEKYCLLAGGYVVPDVVMSFSYTWSPCDIGMRIGRYTSIAEGVTALGAPHPMDWVSTSPFSYRSSPRRLYAEFFQDSGGPEPELLDFDHGTRRIVIGHDVWIGAAAAIKRGVEIGQGAVVGARSVVTKNVPPYAIVAGAPARIIRYRFDDALVGRLLALRWWRFTPDQLRPLDVCNPQRFVEQLEERIERGMEPPAMSVLRAREMIEAGERV